MQSFISKLCVLASEFAIATAVINGAEATISPDTGLMEFPSFAALVLTHKTTPGRLMSCGGTLYRYSVVLTAAHCVHGSAVGSLDDWNVNVYLMPRLNPRLVSGPSTKLSDAAAFASDQAKGMGVKVSVDMGNLLVHQGFGETLDANGDEPVLVNDLALIPLTRFINASSDPAWAGFETDLPGKAKLVDTSQKSEYRFMGLGDMGSSSETLVAGGPKVCFRSKGAHLPCQVQTKSVTTLQYGDCMGKCVAWLTEITRMAVPGNSKFLSDISRTACSARLAGVKEGRLLCAHHPTGSASAGDSGGPLLLGKLGVIGVLSWADVMGTTSQGAQHPALFESTDYHREAIDGAVDCLVAAPAGQAGACVFGPSLVRV